MRGPRNKLNGEVERPKPLLRRQVMRARATALRSFDHCRQSLMNVIAQICRAWIRAMCARPRRSHRMSASLRAGLAGLAA